MGYRRETKAFSNLLQKVCHTPKGTDSAHLTPSAWKLSTSRHSFTIQTGEKISLTSESRFLSRRQGCSHHQEDIKHGKSMSICNWHPLAKHLIHSRPGNQMVMPDFHCGCLGQRIWTNCRIRVSQQQMVGVFIQVVWPVSDFMGPVSLIFNCFSFYHFPSLFLSHFLTISPWCLLSVLVMSIFFILLSTLTEVNAVEEKLN